MTQRLSGKGRVACTTLQHYGHEHFRRILYRTLLWLAGRSLSEKPLRVGLLGYPPWLGRLHAEAAVTTPGLALSAVCDLNPQRIAEAQCDFPELKASETATALAHDPEVDLVIVSTPPNSHARLCLEMMNAGKHVLCEKPLALDRGETDALIEAAAAQRVHLSCHQNRRWDVDYLAIRSALSDGLIGELFYLETFVGGFSHPCGYWHSHQSVSGGTAYDWGAHYLDWVVSLVPAAVTAVVGTRHKRVWHDVTNSDQERVQIRFSGGQEAEFIHSDIAAATKPKWYLLGTEGAIVSHWRQVSTYEIDPVHYFQQHDIPATEMPPELWLSRRIDSGAVEARRLPLPERRPFAFHQNLADYLLLGEPLAAPLEDSVQVVTILEAAARSAANGGRRVELDG
jgi:predicted dehydrogenase